MTNIPIPLTQAIEPHADPVPPAELTPDSYAERLYAALAPIALRDPDHGWALLILVNAIGGMFQEPEDLARDTPEGPGWSALMDLDRCPDMALPWLAQFVGVRPLPGSTEDEQRLRIASTDGFKRGTPAAIRGAVEATLTGNRIVYFRERDPNGADPPYTLEVVTLTAETPDPGATLAALLAQKPGGIVLTYRTVLGQDWQELQQSGNTWRQARTTYATWRDMRASA